MGCGYSFCPETTGAPLLKKNETILTTARGGWELPVLSRAGRLVGIPTGDPPAYHQSCPTKTENVGQEIWVGAELGSALLGGREVGFLQFLAYPGCEVSLFPSGRCSCTEARTTLWSWFLRLGLRSPPTRRASPCFSVYRCLACAPHA